MRIEKTINYEEKDLIEFSMMTLLYKRGLGFIIITIIFALSILILFVIQGRLEQLEIMLIIIYCTIIAATPLLIYFRTKKTYKTSKVFKQEQSFIISDEGITGKSSLGESKISWDLFYEFAVLNKFIAFYISSRQAYILPKRCLNYDEYNEIRLFLISNENTKSKTKLSKII